MSWILVATMIASGCAVGMILLPLAIKLAHRYDLLDLPGRHKRHKRPVPILGGPVLFVAVWLPILVFRLVSPASFAELGQSLWYMLAGALVILLVGLSDDLSPISPYTKLASQIAAALILFMGGLQVELISTPYGSLDVGSWSILITLVWVVGLSNAINLIDGLDGLAGGICLIAGLTMLAIGQLHQVATILTMICATVGFLLPFLYYNRHPARIFLGDSGSLQLGYYFAVFSLVVPLKSFTFTALYLPLLALGVPILEAVSSLVRRLLAGKSVFRADRRHLFHYLALAGLSPGQVVWVFYVLAMFFGGFSLAMYYFNRRLVLALMLVFMVVILASFLILLLKLPGRMGNKRSARKPG